MSRRAEKWMGMSATTGKRLLLTAMLVAVCGSGCGWWSSRPNVVILLMDTMRPDHLGCYGYDRETSPQLDGLAAKGVVFGRCYATADYTSASTASLFTGKYPLAHGYVNADNVLEEENETIAELFRERGYRTAGFTANGLVGEKYQMHQGFDEFFEKNRASAEEMMEEISAFVRRSGDEPFLVYAHFMDVHDPYRMPRAHWDRFADPQAFAYDMADTLLHERFVMDAWWGTVQKWWEKERGPDASRRYFDDYTQLYDAAIAYWDGLLGGFFALLEARDRETIVVVLADHGEQLLEHGFFGHANSGYDVGLHIPLIIYDPLMKEDAPRRIDRPMSIADLLPTLLARLDMEIPEAVQGEERWSLVRGLEGSGSAESGVYTEGTFMANRPFSTLIQTYREGRWKLILDRFRDGKELYDLRSDPGEERDLFTEEPEVVDRLAARLRQQYGENLEIFARLQRSALRQKEEKLKELRALGYLAGRRRPDRARSEFFPMRAMVLKPFGPFGDEEDLSGFGERLDFIGGRVTWGQVIRGYSDRGGRADSSGAWFDRRATFLMRNSGGRNRVVFEVNVVADGEEKWPTRMEVEFNGRAEQSWDIPRPGRHRLEARIPTRLLEEELFHCGLLANHRFVLREGDSARFHRYGALKICSVSLEEGGSSE
jgi:arylsulfatase A-like enzyme